MSTDVCIEPAARPDLAGIADLDARCFDHPWRLEAYEREWERVGSTVRLDVARVGSDIVGFLLGHRVADVADVVRIAVDASHRRRGVGSRLLEAFLSVSLGVDVSLEVRADDAGTIAFYDRHGFRVVGRRGGYYRTAGGRMDALRMVRTVDEGEGRSRGGQGASG